jgi:hypothetical protein
MAAAAPLKGVRHAHPVRFPRGLHSGSSQWRPHHCRCRHVGRRLPRRRARGPINKATRIYSFADFERAFGGLAADSEMSYGVRQFFLNGGTDAWIVRVVKTASPASRTLLNSTAPRS